MGFHFVFQSCDLSPLYNPPHQIGSQLHQSDSYRMLVRKFKADLHGPSPESHAVDFVSAGKSQTYILKQIGFEDLADSPEEFGIEVVFAQDQSCPR
jgi:hypothetical protein